MIDETVRLYSKEERGPVDFIAPHHADLHADLERWGGWNRERYRAGTCDSMEKGYLRGGREAPPAATAPSIINPRTEVIDQAVRLMVADYPQISWTLKAYYVERADAYYICRSLRPKLRWEGFGSWMHACRVILATRIGR